MKNLNADIAVIGGGASGFAAAITAAQNGAGKVVILERLPRTGKKLLATGNGRCNLSHTDITAESYRTSYPHLSQVMAEFEGAESFFERLGLITCSDPQGRIYPYSNAATSVLDALRLEAARLGVEEVCDFDVHSAAAAKGGFTINGSLSARSVILCAGGCAAPSMGSNGSGFAIAEKLGHRIIKPLPSLAPIKCGDSRVKALKGLRVNCRVSAFLGKRLLKSEVGEIQFSDGALSGICIFNLSPLAAEYGGKMEIGVDLMPEYNLETVTEMLFKVKKQRASSTLEDMLTGFFQKRVGQCLIKSAVSMPLTSPASALKPEHIKRIAADIKCWKFSVDGLSPFTAAQVTHGGVFGGEIDGKLCSKLVKGLYLAGEVVDADGDCGGYNLNWAWASGCHAGKNAAEFIKSRRKA